MQESASIIQIAEFRAHKRRKEEELEFYQQELAKLYLKMGYVQREIDLTTNIIDIIEHDKVFEIGALIRK